MKAVLRYLNSPINFKEYEFWGIIVAVFIINAIWPHISSWWFVPVGFLFAFSNSQTRRAWRRKKAHRIKPNDGAVLSVGDPND